jgi:hypothetical protein
VVLEPQPTASSATADPSSLTTGLLTGTSFALPVVDNLTLLRRM